MKGFVTLAAFLVVTLFGLSTSGQLASAQEQGDAISTTGTARSAKALDFDSLNNIVVVDGSRYDGVDACAAIHQALLAVPATGGIVDATGIAATALSLDCTTNNTPNPFAGISSPVKLKLGALLKISNTWTMQYSNQGLECDDTTHGLDFEPSSIADGHDRAISLDWNEPFMPPVIAVSGNIPIGANSFISAGAVPGFVAPGTWIQLWTNDTGVLDDAIAFDVVQVASVAGETINVNRPFRTAFSQSGRNPGTNTFYSPLQATRPSENQFVRNCLILSKQTLGQAPGIAVMRNRNSLVERNVVQLAFGQPLYSYRSVGARYNNNKIKATSNTLSVESEFAESVDLEVSGLECVSEGTIPFGCIVVGDFGLGFFRWQDIKAQSTANVFYALFFGAHDGVIRNIQGWAIPGKVALFNSLGSQKVVLTNGRFTGVPGASIGINFANYSDAAVTLTSTGNVISRNRVTGFSTNYSVTNRGDLALGGNAVSAVR